MRVAIIGRSEILYDTAQLLREAGHCIVCIVTAREAPEYTRTADDFKKLACEWQIPFAMGARIEEHRTLIQAARADIGVSFNFVGVVPGSVLQLCTLGILNAHGGDLPRYRGNACQAWAILNGEPRIGLCIHKMVGGELDSGDIIARDHLEIDNTTKVGKVWEWMGNRIPQLFLEALNRLAEAPNYVLEVQPKDGGSALRCYPRKPEDGRIDWSQDASHILRLINASSKPYAGAFCDFMDQKFVVWDAGLVPEFENFCAVPGQVTRIGDGFVDVACGKGKLRILMAEYGGEVASPETWINSIRKRLT